MTPEEAIPSRRTAPDGTALTVWVIYDHPLDYPQGYVLRAQYAMEDQTVKVDTVAWFASNPDDLRAIVPMGYTKLMPMQGDDPAILETWI